MADGEKIIQINIEDEMKVRLHRLFDVGNRFESTSRCERWF
jgi:hypothetical protein